MWTSYAIGVVGVVTLAAGWLAVQNLERRALRGEADDTDFLASRVGCCGTACARRCQTACVAGDAPAAEETP